MAARTKRGRGDSNASTGTPLENVLATANQTPLVKMAAKTMLYSAVSLQAQDHKSEEESELWQSFEALILAKQGVPFSRADGETDWKTFLGDNGFDKAGSQQILDLIQKASSTKTQVSLCEFFTSSSAFKGEQKTTTRIFEYQLKRPLSLVSSSISSLVHALPPSALSQNKELDCSHLSTSDASIASVMTVVLDATEAHGWQLPNRESVVLRLPHVLELMRLIDDDKKAGMSQMLLTDMFNKMSFRPSAAMQDSAATSNGAS